MGAGHDSSLFDAILRGFREEAASSAFDWLKEKQPLEIINEIMIPALDFVGKGFEKGTIFLPQLLMSAEAAGAAFEVLKAEMQKNGQTQEKKGKVILATVKGDIHDIGKNIVKVLLENYSYQVIDLGRDVDPKIIADWAEKEHVPVVGLSALMTTTVPSMEATIRLLRENSLGKGDGRRSSFDQGLRRDDRRRLLLQRCHGFCQFCRNSDLPPGSRRQCLR